MFKAKRAQTAMTDLVIVLFVATLLLVFIIFAWNRYVLVLEDDANYMEMQIIAFQTADLLVKSAGEPENWEENPSSVNSIGLAASDRNLSAAKVDSFLNLTYNTTSKSLGVELYDFYFQLKNINGTKLAGYGSAANNTVVNVQRAVLYKNEKTIMEFALWK